MPTLFESRRYLTDFESTRVGHVLTDILVVGSGVAGMRAVIEAARYGDVILITKDIADESATVYAQGGIAGAMAPTDSTDAHARDTLHVGCGLGHPDVVDLTVRDGVERIRELIDWGARFDMSGEDVALGREGGHKADRVLHASGDQTGREIVRTLRARLEETPNVRVFESCFLVDVITLEGRCAGAVTHHPKYGHQLIWASQTILAAGGGGRVYRETTNPEVATGDACAVAYRAGARLRDVELVQFHPTTLYVAGSSRALISEAVRGEGAYLVDRNGDRFMFGYHPDGELAPRDVVSRAIRDNLARTGGTCVFIDVRHIPKTRFEARFPYISRLCEEFDIDVARELIPVRPAAHYMIGGIETDAQARTSVEALLCCGEAASVGLHGANRLASNSLLEGLVFGAAAGRSAGQQSATEGRIPTPVKIRTENPVSRKTRLDLADIRNSLRSLMWRNVGISRSGDMLAEAMEVIEFWGRFVLDKTFDDTGGWETQNMLTTSRLIACGALHRNESRGVQFRADFPDERADSAGAYHIAQQRSGNQHLTERCPLPNHQPSG